MSVGTLSGMTTLKDTLAGENRDAVVRDIAGTVDSIIGSLKGLTGIAISQAANAAKKADPDVVAKGVDKLLPNLCETLQPYWDDYEKAGRTGGFGAFLEGRKEELAGEFLALGDTASEKVNNPAAKKLYSSMRGKIEKLIASNISPIGDAVERNVG